MGAVGESRVTLTGGLRSRRWLRGHGSGWPDKQMSHPARKSTRDAFPLQPLATAAAGQHVCDKCAI